MSAREDYQYGERGAQHYTMCDEIDALRADCAVALDEVDRLRAELAESEDYAAALSRGLAAKNDEIAALRSKLDQSDYWLGTPERLP